MRGLHLKQFSSGTEPYLRCTTRTGTLGPTKSSRISVWPTRRYANSAGHTLVVLTLPTILAKAMPLKGNQWALTKGHQWALTKAFVPLSGGVCFWLGQSASLQ